MWSLVLSGNPVQRMPSTRSGSVAECHNMLLMSSTLSSVVRPLHIATCRKINLEHSYSALWRCLGLLAAGLMQWWHNRLARVHWKYHYHWQGGSGTEPEPETGTVGTVFPETESGTGTAGTVFQEPKPEPEPSFPVKLHWNTEKPLLQRNRQNRKPEPLEPFHPQTVTEPNRTGASLHWAL